ncbi:MAG: sulfotransferase domain-containing protein [Candidatus Heimdallarchaeaceae archaeon]|jgi:hypothetical protein
MKKVFINSLPKSGTNLIAKALDLFGFHHAHNLDSGLFLRDKWQNRVRRLLNRPRKQGYIIGINHPIEISRSSVDRILQKTQTGEYITAHVGFSEDVLLKALELDFKTIQMIRDPRAIAASYVPYVAKTKSNPLFKEFSQKSKEEQYRIVLEGFQGKNISKQTLYTSCLSVEPWINSEDTLVVKFEDIVGEKGGGNNEIQREVLEKISLHIDAPKDKIDQVIENIFGPGRHTFRKGKIDSWKEEIPKDIQKAMTTQLEPILKKWNYD